LWKESAVTCLIKTGTRKLASRPAWDWYPEVGLSEGFGWWPGFVRGLRRVQVLLNLRWVFYPRDKSLA
jgi:hypothetical protein